MDFLPIIQKYSGLAQWNIPILTSAGLLHIYRPEQADKPQLWKTTLSDIQRGAPGERLAVFEQEGSPIAVLQGGERFAVLVQPPGSEQLTLVDSKGAVLHKNISPFSLPGIDSQGQLLFPPAERPSGARDRLVETSKVFLIRHIENCTQLFPTNINEYGELESPQKAPIIECASPQRLIVAGRMIWRLNKNILESDSGEKYILPPHDVFLGLATDPKKRHVVVAIQKDGLTHVVLLSSRKECWKLLSLSAEETFRQIDIHENILWICTHNPLRGQRLGWLDFSETSISQTDIFQWMPSSSSEDLHLTYTELQALAEDGTEIPYVLVSSSSCANQLTPILLTVYGAFGICHRPSAEPTLPAWCSAGGIMVFAQVRGGGERGANWHKAGSGENKYQTIKDLVAVALALKEKYPQQEIVLCGASMGGLVALISALEAASNHPSLISRVAVTSPVLDVADLSRHRNGSFWGSEFPASYELRKLLSPLHRLQKYKNDSTRALVPLWLASSAMDERIADDASRFIALWALYGCAFYWRGEGLGHVGNPVQRINERAAHLLSFAWGDFSK